MDRKTTDLDAVLAGNVLDAWGLADNLDELLTFVALLVEITNVAGGHCFVQGDRDGLLERGTVSFWQKITERKKERGRVVLHGYPGTRQQHEE